MEKLDWAASQEYKYGETFIETIPLNIENITSDKSTTKNLYQVRCYGVWKEATNVFITLSIFDGIEDDRSN